MRGGNNQKKLKLAVSDSDSDIQSSLSQQHILNYHNCVQKYNQKNSSDRSQLIESQAQHNEQEIQNLINQCQQKINTKNKIGAIQQKKDSTAISTISETQTMKSLDKIKQGSNIIEINLKKYEYMFSMEGIDQARKKLASNSLQSQVFKQLNNQNSSKGKLINPALKEKQNKTILNGVPVYFPYKPYELQLTFMESVVKAIENKKNALLQSPTGTGKTLCLLCSILSWVAEYNKNTFQKVHVIYCSRTHTQLKQVQNQLQKTCFRPTMSNFGSRDQFCIKKEFSTIKGRDLMQACSKAVKLQLKQMRNRTMRMDDDPILQQEQPTDQKSKQHVEKQKSHACGFFKSEGQYQQILSRYYTNEIVTSEMIKNEGQIKGFCPYYYPFQIKQKADIIFMPYNYILDVSRLHNYVTMIKNGIIILDEAHNVPEAACQGRSYEMYSRIFDNVDTELKKLQYHPFMSPQLRVVSYEFESTRIFLVKEYGRLRNYMEELAQKIYNRLSTKKQFDNYSNQENFDFQQIMTTHEMKITIYSWFSTLRFNSNDWDNIPKQKQIQIRVQVIKLLEKMVQQTNSLIQELKQTYDGIFQNMQKLNSFINKARELISQIDGQQDEWWSKESNHYRLLIKTNMKQSFLNYQYKFMCLTPSLTFGDLLKLQPRSIILTSGTLAPMEAWQKQLKVSFEVQLMNKHVVDKSQVHLGIVCKSILNQNVFNFSYNELQKKNNIFGALLKTIAYFGQNIPNGILVIFPSYRVIKNFKAQLMRDNNELNKLRNSKFLCFEDKGTTDYIIINFKEKAKTKKGAMLFCVCRGKVSQGLDFSDQLCRAVVFVGVPFANVKDPLLKQKMGYYDKLSKVPKVKNTKAFTGDQWYTLNTMRAVNQGIGRVIRHINDYGMIFMLDNRYEQVRLKNMLPAWARQSITTYHNFIEVQQKIRHFYTQMNARFPSQLHQDEELPTQFSNHQPIPKQIKKPKSIFKAKAPTNAFEIMMNKAKRDSKKSIDKKKITKKTIDFL